MIRKKEQMKNEEDSDQGEGTLNGRE